MHPVGVHLFDYTFRSDFRSSLSLLIRDCVALTHVFREIHLQLKVFHNLVCTRSLTSLKPSFNSLLCICAVYSLGAAPEFRLVHNLSEAHTLPVRRLDLLCASLEIIFRPVLELLQEATTAAIPPGGALRLWCL